MAANSTHGTFSELLARTAPQHRPLCKALRGVIAKLHPELIEIVWTHQGIASYGVGPKKMSEHYAYIAAQKNHVNLGFYHGVDLADPDELLEGTGKRLRHVKLKSSAEAGSAAVKALLVAAIADRRQACR